ncbi:MAG TPA: hypothetical protein VGQ57_16515, partial [Polyangiaceae bacterium]|nr:hypothetical protein [Polyangiaceae bacterium]
VVAASDAGTIGCALIDDGTVACWQTAANANAHGALGNGTLETDGALLKATTVVTGPAAPLEHVTQFAQASSDGAGGICAITDAHELYCWGALDWLVNGGKGLNSPYAQPITLDGLETMTGVKQAAIAFGGGCALRDGDDGNEVWCWGAGRNAQLPDSKDSQYPVRILGLTNPTEVAADGTFVYDYVPIHTYCAIDDGNVRCWGSMAHGEGGDDDAPNATSTPSLVKIGNGTELSGVTALTGAGNAGITSGSGNFCALRGSALWCWGAQFGRHASNYGATNVTMLGDARGPTFLTNDEVLHVGSTLVTPNCGKL